MLDILDFAGHIKFPLIVSFFICFLKCFKNIGTSPIFDKMVNTSSSNAGSAGLILWRGAKIPQAKKLKQKQYCINNKFNKDFKNEVHIKKLKKKNLSMDIYQNRLQTSLAQDR